MSLQIYKNSNYEGHDDIILGDGYGLKITYIGTTQLSLSSHIFSLKNILCVPFMKRNLIFFLNSINIIMILLSSHPLTF